MYQIQITLPDSSCLSALIWLGHISRASLIKKALSPLATLAIIPCTRYASNLTFLNAGDQNHFDPSFPQMKSKQFLIQWYYQPFILNSFTNLGELGEIFTCFNQLIKALRSYSISWITQTASLYPVSTAIEKEAMHSLALLSFAPWEVSQVQIF